MEISNLPPQAIEIEQAIIGACMIESEAFENIKHILSSEMFYSQKHQELYKVFIALNKDSECIDMLTVGQYVSTNEHASNIISLQLIASLTTNIASAAHITSHALIIRDKFIKRSIIDKCRNVIDRAYDDLDVLEINTILNEAIEISESKSLDSIVHISQAGAEHVADLVNRSKGDGVKPIKTHIKSLNRILPFGGLIGGDYVILGARPSMGKTAVALDLQSNIEEPSLFISLEMGVTRLYNRLLLADDSINGFRLKENSFDTTDWENYHRVTSYLNSKNMFFDGKSKTLNDILAAIKKAVRKHGVRVIFIDYIGLIQYDSGRNREQDISQISQAIKHIASTENVAIVVLSQLNRAGAGRPILKDLRDSGSLEQDADFIGFIHREDYGEKASKGNSAITEIVVRKNRDGSLDTINLHRNSTFSKYWEAEGCYSPIEEEEPF